jgi:predicted enzyme related to lactoylglutathione lyase
MTNTQEARIGAFCWVELATTDDEAAKDFYTGLFNWSYDSEKLPGDMGNYHSGLVNKSPAAGIFKITKDMAKMGIPPHWGSYIRVESVDQSVAKAKELGAEILQPGMDVFEAGRMAALKDPCGAKIHIWEKKSSAGAAVQNETTGAFSWNELWTNDLDKAKKFYCNLFGWTAKDSKFDGKTYISFTHKDGYPAGGMMEIDEDMGNLVPHWGIYFTVGDVTKAINYSKENGGKLHFGPHPVEGVGEFAFIQDPQGASLGVIQLKK